MNKPFFSCILGWSNQTCQELPQRDGRDPLAFPPKAPLPCQDLADVSFWMISRAHLESPQFHAPPTCLSGCGLLLAPGKQVVPLCPEASSCNYRLAGPVAKCASQHGSLLPASLCLGPVS